MAETRTAPNLYHTRKDIAQFVISLSVLRCKQELEELHLDEDYMQNNLNKDLLMSIQQVSRQIPSHRVKLLSKRHQL